MACVHRPTMTCLHYRQVREGTLATSRQGVAPSSRASRGRKSTSTLSCASTVTILFVLCQSVERALHLYLNPIFWCPRRPLQSLRPRQPSTWRLSMEARRSVGSVWIADTLHARARRRPIACAYAAPSLSTVSSVGAVLHARRHSCVPPVIETEYRTAQISRNRGAHNWRHWSMPFVC